MIGSQKPRANNETDRIALHGSLALMRDEVGLELARVLRDVLEKIVAALEGDQDLPEGRAV